MNNNFLSRLVMLLGAIVLTCNVAWGDAQFDQVQISYELNGTTYNDYYFTNSGGEQNFTNGAIITSELKITKVWMWYRQYNGNVCNGQLGWNFGDETDHWHGWGNWSWSSGSWSFSTEGNVGSKMYNEAFDLVLAKNTDPSGNYNIYYWWQMNGALTSSTDCNHDWYNKNGNNNYHLSYTILPPRPNASPSANATGAISGEGTSSKPWLVEVGNTLTITGAATQEWEDANSVLMISTSNSTKASSYSSSIQYSSESPTESTSVTIYYRYVNSSAEIVSSNNRYKTVYYQFVQPRTVNFDAGTGSVTSSSMTEASYGAGITLPTATPQSACADAGWTFAGWAKASQTGTAIAPELLAADANYKPTSDGETLYAVYKITQGGTPSDDFVKVTSVPTDWSGDYIMVNHSVATAMNGTLSNGTFGTTSVTIIDNTITNTNTAIIWTFTAGSTAGQYSLKNNSANKYAKIKGTGTTDADLSDTPIFFTIANSSTTGVWKVVSVDNDARCFAYNSTNGDWRTNAKSNNNTGNLYKRVVGAGTTTYNSNPIAAVQYDLTFDLNGGTGTQPDSWKRKQNDEITDFPSVTDFVKTGYRCIGWNTTNNATTALTSYTMPGANATLYAVWIPTYAITWVVEGNTIQTDLPINGEAINKPVTDPESINNRVFVGWSATPIAGHANAFTDFVSHNCTGAPETWYAVFATPEYTKANSLTDGGTYIITSQKAGKTVYLPNAAATGGDGPALGKAIDINGTKISTIVTNDMLWTFNSIEGGWQIQSVAETDKYLGTTTSDGKTVRVNTSYNKAWTIADNTMKYNANESKCLYIGPYTDDDHWYANSSPTSNKFASTTITFYTFVANTYRNYTTAPSTATYSVVYDLNGGEGTAINQYELLTGASVTLPSAPSLFGYTFTGWSDGSQTYNAGTTYTIGSANVTLTAQWTILVPTSFTLASSNGYDLGTETNNTTQMSVASWEPANLLDSQKGVTWSIKSGDESYLTVDENGLVTVIGCSANATVVATSIADPTITAEFTVHIYAPFCPGYSFRYGTEGQGDWNNCDPVCFTETDKADGYEGKLFISDLFTIPNKPKFEVWWEDRREGWSEFADMTALPLHHLHSNHSIYKIEEGKGLGATGYLVIYGGYNTKNKYIDFMPDGYVLRLGSGDIWTSVPFYANEDIWSTTWETNIMELTNDITSGKFYVGVKTAEDYVWLEGISKERNMTDMGKKSGKGESWGSNISSGDNGKHGKFRIYANSNNDNGNWFCHFVPYYQIAFNTDGGSAVAPGYVSIEAENKSYTVTMSSETNPTRVGYKFAGWNDGSATHTESWTINDISQDINLTAVWNKVNTLTFHYDGFTTDCDDVWSVATGEQVTLPDGKIVVGKTFNGWLAQGSETPLAAGSTYTMPANNVTLTATYTNWTISYNYNGTIVSGVEVPETGVVLPTTVPDGAQGADNNIFIGFTKTQDYSATDLPADFIAAGSVYTPAAGGEILYALYRQGDAEYKLIKDTKDLRLGAHVVLASIDEDYAMGKNFVEGQDTLPAIVVTKDGDNETISFGKDVQEWTLTTNGNNVGSWSFRRASDNKYLASSNTVGKVTLGTNVTTGSSFRIAIDASGRAMVQCVANYNISTLSMGDKGAFGCYNPNTIDAPDLAIYQHIGTKYVTTPTAVYRVKSVDMVNGRLDKNDYYAEGTSIDLNGYANEGYSTSNVYRVYNEATHDTISKTKTFTMPAYNVVDTLTNRALLDTLKFVVPECVTPTPSNIRANGNTEVNLPNEVANVNSWNFVGWTKTAINDTSEVHSEIFTTYTTPRLKKDSAETFYAIYSYDGLPTTGFVLSTVNSATTYYLGKYESGYNNRYFNAVTDKAQALVLYNEDGKLYYHSADTLAYLKANNQSSTYNLLTTNEANATVWTIEENEETNVISIKTTINATDRYLRYSNANARYNIYTNLNDPVSEKALSYTTNPVCAQYAYYFTSDEEEAEPEYVYEMGQDGKVIPYSPKTGCNTKRFIGWSETKVSELQQEAPTIVDVATQTYDRDVTLYAVYAAENGGKIVGDAPTTIDNVTAMGAFKTAQDSGMTSLNTRYFYHNAECYENTLRLKNGKNLDSSYITTSLIRNLEKIQVVYTNLKPIVSISSDRKSWTEINLTKVDEIYIATPDEPGDYYVAFSIKTSSSDNYSYSRISSVTYTHNKQYWYSDYSTNCNTDETAKITYAESSETAYQTTSIGEVIALPTPKTEGKHFEGWTINGVNYAGGESYKLSYNVTATATWTDAQLTCTPETLYVVSAKGKTVRSSQTIQISCPEITTGTLTIEDQTSDNGATTFHAVITNAEANEETGLNATVAIEFTHNAQNQNRNATMTATIGEEPNKKQVQFHVHGRSLPEKFVIAHQGTDSKWYALPADITAYNTYAGYVIPVVDNKATATTNAIYHLGVDETDHSIVRFLATDTTALMTQENNNNIKVGKVATDENNLTQWYIQTSNNSQYVLKNKVKAKNLIFNNSNRFGMFASGDTLFQILPVENEVAVITAEVTQWTENGFSFIPNIAIPTNDAFSLVVNGETITGATCTNRYDLYDVTYTGPIAAQQTMQLQWTNSSKPVATATVVSPARVTVNTTLSALLEGIDAKNLDIVVASGTLTVDEKATIHNLDICAGATVAITNDTLTTNTLTFRGGLTSTESDYNYEVPRLYIAKDVTTPGYIKPAARVYYYLNVNSNHFYPFTVPYKAAIENIHYASRPNTEIQSIWGNAIKISKYDGEARGQGKATTTKYWSDMSYSNNLIPGVGYIITAKKQKNDTYATLRFLMMVSDIDATTDTVTVGAWGVGPETTTAWYNQGWNYIANPYTAMLAGNNADAEHHAIQSGTEVRYATIPSPIIDGYDQVPMNEAELKPFYGFFIQAGADGNYNFVKGNRHAAPAYLLAKEKPEQEAYINLDGAAMHDQFGLIMGSNYSSDYEINADLTKELGTANDLRAWLMTGETKMAYLAVDDETARTLIPLNLRTPAEGEYTFSIRESSRVEDLEGLYLFDMESGTTTNLIGSDYTFSAPAGAVENRFALNAIRSAHAPTELGEQTDRLRGRGDPPYKRLKDGHIYIIVNDVIYDAEGKEVIK